MAQSIVPHDKPYKRLPDHPILPNKEIWNIAPHCETTNQQAHLSEGHISVVLRHSSREKNGKKDFPHSFTDYSTTQSSFQQSAFC
jgi:hypothetical protein